MLFSCNSLAKIDGVPEDFTIRIMTTYYKKYYLSVIFDNLRYKLIKYNNVWLY